ncbi:MAG TPA: hypothetical protein DCG49_08360, partial [Ruminococcus sp.]|nr:hypothetical protein [Ruminococcus sp.]
HTPNGDGYRLSPTVRSCALNAIHTPNGDGYLNFVTVINHHKNAIHTPNGDGTKKHALFTVRAFLYIKQDIPFRICPVSIYR